MTYGTNERGGGLTSSQWIGRCDEEDISSLGGGDERGLLGVASPLRAVLLLRRASWVLVAPSGVWTVSGVSGPS